MNEQEMLSRLSAFPDRDVILLAGLIVLTNQVKTTAPGTWTVNSPDIDNVTLLPAVAAVSDSDVWIAGNRNLRPELTGLAAHWDGKRWTRYDFPKGSGLSDVTAVATDDVWIVGDFTAPGDPMDSPSPIRRAAIRSSCIGTAGSGEQCRPRRFPAPRTCCCAASPPAPPMTCGPSACPTRPRGNDRWPCTGTAGSQWSPMHVSADGGDLDDVLALAPDDVWAVGRGQIFHWDGLAWQTVPVPGTVWAVGTRADPQPRQSAAARGAGASQLFSRPSIDAASLGYTRWWRRRPSGSEQRRWGCAE